MTLEVIVLHYLSAVRIFWERMAAKSLLAFAHLFAPNFFQILKLRQ